MNTANPPSPPPSGHPKALYLLFATEMWERMSYYGMRALLVLYLVDRDHGGMGYDEKFALHVYGLYTALVYLTPLFGGALADRFLGARRAAILGGLAMVLGHFLMALPGPVFLYTALGCLIVGNGLFKPNISTMVGGLYAPGDSRREGGFTLFYMGINLGAFLSPLVCGTLGEKWGWHYGFAAAGVGMTIGIVTLLLGKKILGDVGLPSSQKSRADLPSIVGPAAQIERDRIVAILLLSACTVLYWAAYEQAGGLINLFTEGQVDRWLGGWEVPTSWFQSVNPLFIVALAPVISVVWVQMARRRRDPAIPTKMGIGILVMSSGFLLMWLAAQHSRSGHKSSMTWIIAFYFLSTLGELCLSPISLSMVTRLAPPKRASLLMGAYFAFSGIGNYLAGYLGGMSKSWGAERVFSLIGALTLAMGALLLVARNSIRRLMHEGPISSEPA